MVITYDDFKECCPAAEMPDAAVFESITSQIETWRDKFRRLASPEIFDRLDEPDAAPVGDDYDRLTRLRRHIVGAICSLAFWEAIPQLDLVLTPTGFGVVSNQNVAPASAERVKALRTQIRRQGLLYFEEALEELRRLGAPEKSPACARFFRSIFWKSAHLHVFGIPQPTYDDLVAKLPEINRAQMALAKIISPELMAALISAEASASATPLQEILMSMLRVLCVYDIGGNPELWRSQRLAVIGFIEEHLDDFPEYRDSNTYQANHLKPYENKAGDPCFFFG